MTGNDPFNLSTSPLLHESHVLYTLEHLAKGPLAIIYRDLYSCNTIGQSLISCCLLALAKIYFGFHNRDTEVLRDGICLYSQGLGMLSDALGHDDCQVTTETIASVLSLSVAEVGDISHPNSLALELTANHSEHSAHGKEFMDGPHPWSRKSLLLMETINDGEMQGSWPCFTSLVSSVNDPGSFFHTESIYNGRIIVESKSKGLQPRQ